MSSSAPRPNPCLVAILLVIQTHSGSGSRLVFHYPPDPLSPKIPAPEDNVENPTTQDDSSSSSSNGESSTDDDPVPSRARDKGKQNAHTPGTRTVLTDEEDDDDEQYLANTARERKEWRPSWEPLLGFGSGGLTGLLAPGRPWHKRRFELCINSLCFLGWPVFARQDGTWRRRKSKRGVQRAQEDSTLEETDNEETTDTASGTEKAKSKLPYATSNSETRAEKMQARSNLTMFNVVFVLDPPQLEYSLRTKEMYEHVIKRFTRVLKHQQAHNDYVSKESELIHSIKAKHYSLRSPAKTFYSEILPNSSLATAISTVFSSISASQIASFTIPPNVPVSLQIPPVTSMSYLPSPADPPCQPGLWLTTTNDPPSISSTIDSSTSTQQLAKHFTLLLKTSPAKILKELQTSASPDSALLTAFISALSPTKSFYKISQRSQIPLPDVQFLAQHLIYWRRAIAIPPLHQRDTYVVSPNADMRNLKAACKAYEVVFPTVPSLTQMLHSLSGTPRPFGVLIPSSDHKEKYYEVLAWLMREGWVTQLRTFAYVRVDPKIKKAVKDQEKLADGDKKGNKGGDEVLDQANRPALTSPQSSTSNSSTLQSATPPDNPNVASLILNPQRASPLESKWLLQIGKSLVQKPGLRDEDRANLIKYWPVFTKYFNGAEALEKIHVREGLKRKMVWDLLALMGLDFESAVEFQNDQGHTEERVLVTIRHW